MLMFGTAEAKAEYLSSRQLPTRGQLDDTATKTLKVEYWIKVAKKYADESVQVVIDVNNEQVSLYLRSKLRSELRVAWSASKLREHFRELRADYEGSEEFERYKRSGQNGPLFYPDFQKSNATHVMLHYLLKGMPRGGVLGDLPEGAVVDTNQINDDDTDTEDSADDQKPDDQQPVVDLSNVSRTPDRPPPTKRSRRRLRSVSPTSSIGSSVSKISKESHGIAMFTKSCQAILEKLHEAVVAKPVVANPPQVNNLCDRSEQYLRLVNMKMRLKKTLQELAKQAQTDDDQDSIKLLRIQLKTVSTQIAKQVAKQLDHV